MLVTGRKHRGSTRSNLPERAEFDSALLCVLSLPFNSRSPRQWQIHNYRHMPAD